MGTRMLICYKGHHFMGVTKGIILWAYLNGFKWSFLYLSKLALTEEDCFASSQWVESPSRKNASHDHWAAVSGTFVPKSRPCRSRSLCSKLLGKTAKPSKRPTTKVWIEQTILEGSAGMMEVLWSPNTVVITLNSFRSTACANRQTMKFSDLAHLVISWEIYSKILRFPSSLLLPMNRTGQCREENTYEER